MWSVIRCSFRAFLPVVHHALFAISAYASENDATGCRRLTNNEGRTTGRKARNEQRMTHFDFHFHTISVTADAGDAGFFAGPLRREASGARASLA